MKNEKRMEFWWDEGTGSVITKVVTTCAPPLDYKRERSVWGVWLHVPAEAIRGSTCRIASFTLIWSDVCADEQTTIGEASWALGGALQESQMIWICEPQSFDAGTVSYFRYCRWRWLHVATGQKATEHLWISNWSLSTRCSSHQLRFMKGIYDHK